MTIGHPAATMTTGQPMTTRYPSTPGHLVTAGQPMTTGRPATAGHTIPTAQSASMGQSMMAGFAGQPMTGEQVIHRGPPGNSPCDLCVQDD